MAQSYTDLAAQHAITRVENLQTLSPPPVPQGAPRFTSGGIAHPVSEAFPPYLRPEGAFIEGVCPMEKVGMDPRIASAAISPSSARPQGSRDLSEIQRRNLLVTPPREPINRLAFEPTEKVTKEHESEHDNPASSADKSSVSLVRVSDESEAEDSRQSIDDSVDQETSQSIIPLSQTQDLGLSIAESSQSIIPHSQEYGLRSTDEDPGIDYIIEIYLRQTRRGRPVTKCGRVTEIKPNEPNRVK